MPKRLRKKFLAKQAGKGEAIAKGAQGAQGGGAVEKQLGGKAQIHTEHLAAAGRGRGRGGRRGGRR